MDCVSLQGKLENTFNKLPSFSDTDKKPKNRWSKKQKRTFRHLLNGTRVSQKIGCKDLKFVTLTSSDVCVQQVGYDKHSLSRDVVRLRQRIERLTPWKLYKYGYLSRSQIARFYGRNSYNDTFGHIGYLQVFTNEGNGVVHILGRFPYLPYNYLASEWMDIHLSFDINITRLNLDYEAKNTASYIVSQYIANQDEHTSYVRSSMSKDWIFPGHRQVWMECLHRSKDWTKQFKTEWGFWSAPIQIDIAVKVWDSYLDCIFKDKPIKHLQKTFGSDDILIDLLPGSACLWSMPKGVR